MYLRSIEKEIQECTEQVEAINGIFDRIMTTGKTFENLSNVLCEMDTKVEEKYGTLRSQ